jgi:hypothetical protein
LGSGDTNTISGAYASRNFIGTGRLNDICTEYDTNIILNGKENTISGYSGFNTIVNGSGSVIHDGNWNFIGAGVCNSATPGDYTPDDAFGATIVNGVCNTGSGQYSFIGSGKQNHAASDYSIIVGGILNTASAVCSFIGLLGGGCNNSITGALAQLSTRSNDVIVGGSNNKICGACNTNSNSILGRNF